MPKLTERPEWKALEKHYQTISQVHLRDLFSADSQRASRFTIEAEGLLLDYSKNRITSETVGLLVALAESSGLGSAIQRMSQAKR